MCLSEVYTDEDMNKIVEELPEVAPNVVRLVKHIVKEPSAWRNFFSCIPRCVFQSGINVAVRHHLKHPSRYWTGFHFLTKRFWTHTHIITCLVKKEWITAVGKDTMGLTLVASQAFFPTYPETEARLEDFLAWLKDNDPEWAESQLCEAVK